MLQLAKQITAAGAVSISQRNTITTGNSNVLCLCMVPMHSYYDMGVLTVIVIVYTLHVWGPLELQLFIIHWVIKRRQQRQSALEI